MADKLLTLWICFCLMIMLSAGIFLFSNEDDCINRAWLDVFKDC